MTLDNEPADTVWEIALQHRPHGADDKYSRCRAKYADTFHAAIKAAETFRKLDINLDGAKFTSLAAGSYIFSDLGVESQNFDYRIVITEVDVLTNRRS